MYLDCKKLHTDVFKKLSKEGISQKQLYKETGLSQGVLWHLNYSKDMRATTFISITEWLEKDINEYIKQK